jgi:hypothetical protein
LEPVLCSVLLKEWVVLPGRLTLLVAPVRVEPVPEPLPCFAEQREGVGALELHPLISVPGEKESEPVPLPCFAAVTGVAMKLTLLPPSELP